MFQRVTRWLKERIRGRPFEAFQIEVTTRCLLRCAMCPRVALADQWPQMDLPWQTFERLASAFDRTRHVHLQGWGEPLLHPRLFDMIALAKGAGCRVGLTTNGMRLELATGQRLLELDPDLIAISIAGATADTHERIRVGSDFALILENVRRLLALRAAQEKRRPKVELSYLMTRANVAELPKAVELAASLGVDELYATNLDYVVTRKHDDLKAFGCPPLREAFVRTVAEAREKARRLGLAFRPYPLDPEEVAVCEANPLKILFISCDGWVSPCSYMGLAGRADIPRRFDGRSLAVPRLRFGNVLEQDLLDIWNSAAYRAFREQLARRRLGVAAWAIGSVGGHEEIFERKMPPPPEPCRTCYKLYGV
jgi:MoaA/NifB/PqqE/SkfB family radical SAM enzyme